MFKVSASESENTLELDVEGRLAGPWVEELRQYWQRERLQTGKPLRVRLSSVTFIDDAGKGLLKHMFDLGARLEGRGCLVRAILAEITGLPAPSPCADVGSLPKEDTKGSPK